MTKVGVEIETKSRHCLGLLNTHEHNVVLSLRTQLKRTIFTDSVQV